MNDESEDDIRTSRGTTSVMGKCICGVKVWLPPEIDHMLQEAAFADGANASEFIRDMLCIRFKGKTWGELTAESRRAAVLGTGSITALQVRGEVKS